jgi:hypothetical protein
MPVTADSYEAKVMERATFMLCSCASFRAALAAVLGVTVPDATAAKAYVIESWGGDGKRHLNVPKVTFADGVERALPRMYAIIDLGEDGVLTEEAGIASDDYSWRIVITIWVPRLLTGETAPDAIRRARNLQGNVRTDYRAQFGATNCLARMRSCAAAAVLPPPAEGADADKIQIPLEFDCYG